jgi:hypothetical protein
MRTAELAYWINERERMRIRKELHVPGLKNVYEPEAWKYGWSDDPHMGLVRYCNVHREDDKVTRWLAEHWRPQHHAVWEIVLARMLNYIPTLNEVITYLDYKVPADPLAEITRALKLQRANGHKIFTSAYTISTCGQRMDKIDYVMGVVSAIKARGEDWEEPFTLDKVHRQLIATKGLGSFLAAQVVADLKNTAGHPLQTAPDRATWCAPGPGSLRGLGAFYGHKISPSDFKQWINNCWEYTKPLINESVLPIDMQDFQNCLCEFSKYMRVSTGAGHARNKYSAG